MNPISAAYRWVEKRFLGDAAGGLGGSFGAGGTLPAPVLSGVAVTPETALTFTSCFACINVRSTDLASLPLRVRRELKGGGRVTVAADPRHDLVFCEPNRDTSSMRFRQALLAHRLGWGNGYAEIVRLPSGMPAALHLHSPRPTDTWPERSRSGALWYQCDGGRRQIRAEDMVHVAGLGFDGIRGYSVISMHRQAVGYGLAMEQSGAAFHGNAATPKGAIKLKKVLTPEAQKNLRESIADVHSGTGNAHRMMILEEGMEYQQISISPVDAEYLAGRSFQSLEMNRIFRVPPPRTMDFTGVAGVYKAFSDLIEDYISSTLGPDAEDVEQELNRKLFTARERAHGLHVSHDFTGLLRGNMQARGAYYTQLFGLGSLSPDEVREREGLNPIPGKVGDGYYRSTVYVPLEDPVAPPAAPTAPPPPEPDGDETDAEPDADEVPE